MLSTKRLMIDSVGQTIGFCGLPAGPCSIAEAIAQWSSA
jgi:hypothetical protein